MASSANDSVTMLCQKEIHAYAFHSWQETKCCETSWLTKVPQEAFRNEPSLSQMRTGLPNLVLDGSFLQSALNTSMEIITIYILRKLFHYEKCICSKTVWLRRNINPSHEEHEPVTFLLIQQSITFIQKQTDPSCFSCPHSQDMVSYLPPLGLCRDLAWSISSAGQPSARWAAWKGWCCFSTARNPGQ